MGEKLPPLVVTALDVVGRVFKLSDLPKNLTIGIASQDKDQQLLHLDLTDMMPALLKKEGKVRLEGMKLGGTLATGKKGRQATGSVTVEVKLGELPPQRYPLTGIKCGRPAQLTLLNPDDFIEPLAAAAPLPPLRMRCVDKDGNPCPVEVTLVQEHDGDAESEDPFEHTGKGKSGKANSPFIIPATGELEIGAKPAFRVNGDAMQHDKEVCATLTFGAWLVRRAAI